MNINERGNAGIKILDLSGSIFIGEDMFRYDRAKTLIQEGAKKLILNMEKVKSIDSSGLGTLVKTHMTAGGAGATLALALVPPKVHELFELTRLNGVFNIYDTEADAIAALS